MLGKLILGFISTLVVALAILQPKLHLLGLTSSISSLGTDQCVHVPALQACEHAWIHPQSGNAYLACSSLSARQEWMPTLLHLSPPTSHPADYISLYSLRTNTHTTLTLKNSPQLYLHAFDVFEHPDSDKLTFYIISHRPRSEAESKSDGADSVLEVFEGVVGGDTLEWKGTIKDASIRTPNSVAVVGEGRFYVTNDHKWQVHWMRALELFWSPQSDIVYCDVSSLDAPNCISAATIVYPNGIAKGPDQLIYSASTAHGTVSIWESQADHSLTLLDEIEIGRMVDNLHVHPQTGAIFAATIPKPLQFLAASQDPWKKSSPMEVWKVSNETSEKQYYGAKYKVEKVVGDDGKIVSGTTTAAPFANVVLLTGVMSREVVICEI